MKSTRSEITKLRKKIADTMDEYKSEELEINLQQLEDQDERESI